jgi:hypothetical protein
VSFGPREERIARNEVRFREINERLETDLRGLPHSPGERFSFVCECGLRECRDLVELSFEEYEAVRSDSRSFAILPGHEIDNVEDVIARTERFWTIRKKDETGPVVEARDPRRGS